MTHKDVNRMREIFESLNSKQQAFVSNYITHWNGSRAARESGYSQKNSRISAVELLRRKDVSEYVELAKKNLQILCGVSAERNIIELAKIAYGNISDLREDWASVKSWDDLPEESKGMISEIQVSTVHLKEGHEGFIKTMKIKTHDKIRALETLNKMMGYNEPDKVELSGPKQIIGMIVSDAEQNTDISSNTPSEASSEILE